MLVSLDCVGRIINPKNIPISRCSDHGSVRVIDQGEEETAGYSDETGLAYAGPFPVVAFGDHTRRVKYISEPFIAGAQGLKVIECKQVCEPKFLFYWLNIVDIPDRGYSRHFQFVRKTQIPLPPQAEQCRIVDEIDKQFSELEAAIKSMRAASDRTAPLRSALLENVFSGTEYSLAPLGTLISSGPQNGLYKPSEAYGSGTAIIRIDDFQDEFLRDRSALRTLALGPNELSTYGLKPGDLVINRVNSMTHLGKCFVVPERICPAVFESNMMRLSLIPDVTPKWVALYLQSPSGRHRLVQNAKQAVNQASINQRDVCSTPVPMPRSLREQTFQIERLETQLDSVRELRVACTLGFARAARLRQAILKKAFEGKLVAQNPNDEPASVLLQRIRAARTHSLARAHAVR
jgi:type I restriction enzyme S subunit